MEKGIQDEARIRRCIQLLRQKSIRVVAFDMDQTAVAAHSQGQLERANLSLFLKKVKIDFVCLVPVLHREGFELAIATHSDEKEFETGRQAALIDPSTHIMGEELASAVLHHCFDKHIASSFFIVAHNPRAHNHLDDPSNCVKRYHMREICNHFSVEPKDIVFFDDTKTIVSDCIKVCGVQAVLVDKMHGFRLDDLIEGLS